MNYLENKINNNGVEILKELEVVSQTQDLQPSKRFKKYDIDKANETFREIGKTGECLVANYLAEKKKNGQISSFIWYNEESESGFPYDFTVQDIHDNVIYFDVKTTGYDFKQKMFFSTQEIDFIANTTANYCIYRVFKNKDGNYLLRICDDCKDLSTIIWAHTTVYTNALEPLKVELSMAKLAISPEVPLLKFKQEVSIEGA